MQGFTLKPRRKRKRVGIKSKMRFAHFITVIVGATLMTAAMDTNANAQQTNAGENQKCRYDFARRRMVCEDALPANPAAARQPPRPVPAHTPGSPADTETGPPVEQSIKRETLGEPTNQATHNSTLPSSPDQQTEFERSRFDQSPPADRLGEQRDTRNFVELRVVNVAPQRRLPIREGPSRRDYVVGRIPSNAQGVRLIDCGKKNWCEIEFRGLTGFVRRRFVKPVDPTVRWDQRQEQRFRVARVPLNDTLNIRQGPSMDTPVVARIPADARGLTLRGRCKYEWCPIKYGRVRGWAGSYYLARDN